VRAAAHFLGIALATALAVAACGGNTDSLTDGSGGVEGADGSRKPGKKATTGTTGGAATNPDEFTGPVPTNSPEGKAFYIQNVHPIMAATCGVCHVAGGAGPAWFTMANAEQSYAQLFGQGFVVPQSRLVTKGAHGGLTTNVFTAAQIGTFEQWVAIETRDGGAKAAPNILEKLGSCFDRTKFDAMQMGQWQTTRRTADNNTNQVNPWNENANQCTGCNNAPCRTCHSADAATNYSNAVGNNIFPAETTFENTKMTLPAYITKFFGVSPDGKPIGSNGIRKKSESTMKDKAYSHPMYTLNAAQLTALDAFVNDAVTKFSAGTCGK
jgi:hypothetical protein